MRRAEDSTPYLLELLHRVVESGVEVVHGGFGFVAHVGKAERSAFDFAVTAINQNALVFHQLLEFGDVHGASTGAGTVADASERDGFESFFREQVKTITRGPVLGHLGELGMTGVAGF